MQYSKLLLYASSFVFGYRFGLANDGWHQWVIGTAAAYMAGEWDEDIRHGGPGGPGGCERRSSARGGAARR